MLVEKHTLNEEFSQKVQELLKSGPIKQNLDKIFHDQEEHQKLIISIDLLRENNSTLAEACVNYPVEMTRIFEEGIKISREGQGPDSSFLSEQSFRVSFEGNLGKHTVTPRGLKSRLINKLIKLQGIVVSSSKVRHRLLKSSHTCETTGESNNFEYNDSLNLRQNKTENVECRRYVPLYNDNNQALTMEYGFSTYKDIQIVTLQEMPENIPTGLMSRSIEVIVQEEMVDLMKPGDRVQVTGIFRPVVSGSLFSSGTFRNCVMATSINLLTSVGDANLTNKEIKSIKAISKRSDLLALLVRSIAPSIFGHEEIKEGLLMQLLGGTEKVIDEAMRLRGDLNILLVGDPSTGKSQFLRRIMTIANLAFSTTGRGSTGVGLTAAITTDKDTNERQLEAGAMVLADRGVICVDEFDKMSIEDRVAMHEVMEQQTVTIAKAGIHVSLNARCSVLAAANPRYGEYEDKRSVETNINMPPSLLSRFDLIFVVRDRRDAEIDRKISSRVTKNHRFEGTTSSLLNSNDMSGVVPPEITYKKNEVVEEFEQFNHFLHEDKNVQYLQVNFLKKYVMYAKSQTPELTDDSNELICKKWTRLRFLDNDYAKNSGNRIIVQTIRSLESLIRISTAYAKLRLSSKVETIDVYRAFELFNRAFYGGTDKIDTTFWSDVSFVSEKKINETNSKLANFKKEKAVEEVQNSPNEKKQVMILDIKTEPVKSLFRFYSEQINKGKLEGCTINELWNSFQKLEKSVLTENQIEEIVDFLIKKGKIMGESGKLYAL